LAQDQSPSATLWALAWPTVLTYAAFSLRQSTDTWMIGQLGTESLAALLPAQQVLFLLQGFALGLFSALNTCASHSVSARGKEETAAYAWQCLWVALVLGGLGASTTLLAVPVFGALDHDFAVFQQEVAYFRVAAFALLPQFIAVTLSNFFFAVRWPMPPMWTGVAHVFINVIFNFILMFGIPGWFEGMGIAGAAWGTLIASSVWAGWLLLIFLKSPKLREFRTSHPVFSKTKLKNLLGIGLPNGAIDVIDILFWNLALIGFIGGFGTEHMAAATVLFTLWLMILVPCDGFGVALTTLVGHELGARNERLAFRYLRACLKMNVTLATTAGLLCILLRGPLMQSIIDDTLVRVIGEQCMFLLGLSLLFDAILYVIDSALNGAGDAVWPLKANFVCNLLFILGGGWLITTRFPEMGSYGIWLCLVANRAVIALVLILRWRSGKWKEMDPVSE